MRISFVLALAVVSAAGCDVVREGSFSKKSGYMERLDGVWALQTAQRTITTSGAVTETVDSAPKQVEFGRTIECLTMTFEAAGDDDRVMYFDAAPIGQKSPVDRCYIITVDETIDRVIFVGEGGSSRDLVYNLAENEADRQVWSAFSAPQADGRVIETRWTLTR